MSRSSATSLAQFREDRTRETLAAIRTRMVKALRGDKDALAVLDRVFPESWDDYYIPVIWTLGNAARFADDPLIDPQVWLDRLVDEGGEPL